VNVLPGENIRTPALQAAKLALLFRGLADWTVVYDSNAEYKGQMTVHPEEKRAVIYAWGELTAEPPDYLFHEVLHAAYRAAVRKGYDGEEEFVQDVCGILTGGMTMSDGGQFKASDERQFQPGDVVRLKSGGPAMTVMEATPGRWIHCRWFVFSEQRLKKAVFLDVCLKKDPGELPAATSPAVEELRRHCLGPDRPPMYGGQK
jgi:uncharacterized protein YodC (DUF2158 family)